MSPTTRELHHTLIRLLKGCLNAWEAWLQIQISCIFLSITEKTSLRVCGRTVMNRLFAR